MQYIAINLRHTERHKCPAHDLSPNRRFLFCTYLKSTVVQIFAFLPLAPENTGRHRLESLLFAMLSHNVADLVQRFQPLYASWTLQRQIKRACEQWRRGTWPAYLLLQEQGFIVKTTQIMTPSPSVNMVTSDGCDISEAIYM